MDGEISRRYSAGKAWIIWTACLCVILLIIGVSSVAVIKKSIRLGVENAAVEFSDTYSNAKDSTYEAFRETAYEMAEKANHVYNEVSISITSLKSHSDLEVLEIKDVEYDTDDGSETKSGTSSWLKVTGSGRYTVDMKAAEYIVDNRRQYVLVRVPKPVLDPQNISIDSAESVFFKENKIDLDNSVKSGVELAQKQIKQAQQKIQETLLSKEEYFEYAMKNAEAMIERLVKSVNPNVSDLTVEVEFF